MVHNPTQKELAPTKQYTKTKREKKVTAIHEVVKDLGSAGPALNKLDTHGLIGGSAGINLLLKQIRQFGPHNCPVLVTGETGTGKELTAKAIHSISTRRNKTLQVLNCAAVPDEVMVSHLFGHEHGSFTGAISRQLGTFGRADEGTVFLDEIGDMKLSLQAILLRALQEGEIQMIGGLTRKVNLRFIFATNRDLVKMVENGHFRQDLFYRISGTVINIPPLRERKEDIPLLVMNFVEKFQAEFKKRRILVSSSALDLLKEYNWPGNVRELENVVRRAVLVTEGTTIEPQNLEMEQAIQRKYLFENFLVKVPPEGAPLEEFERQAILQTLKMSGGVVPDAAKLLHISQRVFRYKAEKLGITTPKRYPKK